MVQAMEVLMITWQDETEPRESEKLKLGNKFATNTSGEI